MQIRPVGDELFHADGRRQTDRHDTPNSRFRNFAHEPKNLKFTTYNYHGPFRHLT
jgi:hypothetical protein